MTVASLAIGEVRLIEPWRCISDRGSFNSDWKHHALAGPGGAAEVLAEALTPRWVPHGITAHKPNNALRGKVDAAYAAEAAGVVAWNQPARIMAGPLPSGGGLRAGEARTVPRQRAV